MKVYMSSRGKVTECEVLSETPKGYRVKHENRWHSGHYVERLIYSECPHGNHRTYRHKEEAISYAMEYIERQENEAEEKITEMDKLRDRITELRGC